MQKGYFDGSKRYKGAKALFENNGDNMFFSELQKLFCKKICLFDPIGFHKVCGNHFSLEDIANIDALATIPGFLVELSLYDEFIQKPFPNIDLNLLKDNSDGKIRGRANSINISRIGQYEVWKFLVILVSLYTALEDKILEKIGCFSSSIWNEGKLYFKSSLVGKKSGLVKAPLSEWGWGPHYRPVDNPCILIHPCKDCQRDYYRNNSIEPIHHWMNFHYKKEECPGFQNYPGAFKDHRKTQTHKEPGYIGQKMIYYCNIGGCSQECECSDCQMGATKDNNTRCKKHIPDHPDNFDDENHIKYHRKIFTIEEVQKEFLVIKLPKMEKDCQICQENVFEH